MKKIILIIILFCGFVLTSCESEQVKMGRRAVYDKINSDLSSGEIEGESHYVIEKGNVCGDRKSTRLNSSHNRESRMPSSA